MRRVLVTRPEPGASQTARRLEALGFIPLLLPLSTKHALFVDRASIPDDIGAVAVTSANAIRHAPREILAILAGRHALPLAKEPPARPGPPAFCASSKGRATQGGWRRRSSRPDRAGLSIYLCGRVRRPEFERTVSDAGIAVKAVEVYDTPRVMRATDPAASILGGLPVDAALLYSAAAAEALLELLERPQLGCLFENTEFFCLSARIAGVLEGKVRDKIRIASEPTEEALLSMLGKSG